jgi:flavin reductase (DIM6/NTAB) family NADH-FMN oxidoreductase RutF
MPVTIWTANGNEGRPEGITVSSILIGEGDPPSVLGLIAPDPSFWDAVRASKRFVVHVLERDMPESPTSSRCDTQEIRVKVFP